jgi:hypothetical protein
MNSSKRSVMPGRRVGRARQRRHLDRIVDDVGRLPQLRLGGLFEQRQLQRAQARMRVRLDAELEQLGLEVSASCSCAAVYCGAYLLIACDDRQAVERLRQVELAP